MADMVLVSTGSGELAEFRGATQDDDRTWKRVKGWMKNLGAGELLGLSITRKRGVPYHFRYMKMVRHAFEHWEPEHAAEPLTYQGHVVAKDFDRFRKDVLIRAGFWEAKYHLDGSVSIDALSINFDSMDQDEFEKVYEPTLKVLLDEILTNYTRPDLERVVAELERFSNE